ncbi:MULTISPECIES: MATE family efflux transporter [Megamonas]|jgi:MATE family multidrug resistance protein|uniref:MATE family efflux transporter n=1 Tax=Megamonas rupellensis TaxID=491921 RepID=A0A412CBV7_9FIRM|nr:MULTISPECIES: MATE family efflux transporter [Megamonas]RGQ77293.1 MATE family efflux transporter [Megamonas rupellensis]BDA09503.1 MATE family efflux transporter [Megamonas funiformis]
MVSQLTYKDYLKITIPFMLATATQPILGAVNTAVMGHMTEVFYIAAVSLGVILFNNIYWLFGFLRVSTTSFSAQALGKQCDKLRFLSLARPIIVAIFISGIFLLIYPILFNYYIDFMKPEIQVIELMRIYCDIVIWGAPFVLLNYVTLGWLMGQMIIRYTMFMQISMNVVNIILSILFVFALDMNIEGVAYASIIAQIYGCIVGFLAIYFKAKLNITKEYLQELKNIKPFLSMMKVNTDLMLRTVCLLTINNLFAIAGASLGTITLAANAVILEIIFIIVYFIDGMANGVSVFSGKALGNKNKVLLEKTLKIGLICLFIFIFFISIISFWGRSYFISMMTNLTEIYMYANEYSFYIILHPIFAGVGLLLYGMYTGVGQTSSIRNMMFVAVIFFYVCQNILMNLYGNNGIWLTYILTYLLESIILVLYLPILKRKFE